MPIACSWIGNGWKRIEFAGDGLAICGLTELTGNELRELESEDAQIQKGIQPLHASKKTALSFSDSSSEDSTSNSLRIHHFGLSRKIRCNRPIQLRRNGLLFAASESTLAKTTDKAFGLIYWVRLVKVFSFKFDIIISSR